jgi:hypothetical protein
MRYWVSSSWLTLISSFSAMGAERLLARLGDLGAVHLVFETVLVLEVTVHLVFDELGGNGDLDALQQLVDDLVARLGTLAEDLRLRDLLLDVGLEFLDGVELARDLREVVVGLGKLALLHGEKRHNDLGLLAGVVATEQLGLEGRGLAGAERVERLVDALDQVARSDLVRDGVGGVDLVAANGGDEVDLGEVALLGGAVDRDERAETAAQLVELVLDVVGRDLGLGDGQRDSLVLGEVEVGTHVDLDGELEVAGEVLLAGQRGDVGLGAAEGADLLVADGLLVELVEPVVHGVVQHLGAAHALVDQRRRNLALAEAGDVHLRGDVLVRVIDAGTQLFGRNGDAELHAGGAELFDRGLHDGYLLMFVT